VTFWLARSAAQENLEEEAQPGAEPVYTA
jgi:hypothetical protein